MSENKTIRYNIRLESPTRSTYIYDNDYFVYEIGTIEGSIPSGAGNIRITDMYVHIEFVETRRSEINFSIRELRGSKDLASNGYIDVDIPYGATSVTAPMHRIHTQDISFYEGYSGELHFWPGGNDLAFILARKITTGYLDVQYTYDPPDPSDASILSLTTIPSVFGGTLVYAIRGDSRCTHKLELSIGTEKDPHNGLSTGENQKVVVPLAWTSKVPQSETGTIIVKLTTYYNGSQYGSVQQASFNVAVPGNIVPTIGNLSVAMKPINDNQTIRDWGLYIQGQSLASLTLSSASSGDNGSWIASYHYLDANGKEIASKASSATSPLTYDASLPSYTGKTFNTSYQCYVVDSRGRRSSTVSCPTITVYTYTDPSIGAVSAIRCNDERKASEEGTYFKLASAFGFTSINEHNLTNCRYEISWKEHSASTYSHLKTGSITGLSDSNTTYKFSQKYGGAVGSSDYMDPQKQYDIKIKIFDTLGNSKDKEIALGTISYTMFFKSEGRGIGIGKMTEEENIDALEVNPEWQMLWGYYDNDHSRPIRIPGVIYTDSSTTLDKNKGRLGMIWLKAT